jgi:beta-lactamase superfamily II metal-dependent hydrolase
VPPAAARLVVDFLDVGHGDAILVTSPAGKRVLIDGGPGEAGARVAAFVRARSALPLDLVVLTHRHADHLGGLAQVIDSSGARLFMDAPSPSHSADPEHIHASPAYARLLALLDRRHIPVRDAVRGRTVDLGGGAVLVLLTPPEPPIVGSRSDVNANSVVVRLELGQVRMLLTGDAEAVTETWLLGSGAADVRADVLKLAHHGSRYASSTLFLAAVGARVAVASCGPAGHSGQLHPETEARVRSTGARLYRTDRDGDIEISTDGRDLRVETRRARPMPPAPIP